MAYKLKKKKEKYYKITYTDPSDPYARRVKTWGFTNKKDAEFGRKDLAVVWDVNPKTIAIEKTSKKYPDYF